MAHVINADLCGASLKDAAISRLFPRFFLSFFSWSCFLWAAHSLEVFWCTGCISFFCSLSYYSNISLPHHQKPILYILWRAVLDCPIHLLITLSPAFYELPSASGYFWTIQFINSLTLALLVDVLCDLLVQLDSTYYGKLIPLDLIFHFLLFSASGLDPFGWERKNPPLSSPDSLITTISPLPCLGRSALAAFQFESALSFNDIVACVDTKYLYPVFFRLI